MKWHKVNHLAGDERECHEAAERRGDAEFFDVGQSRAVSWSRRPESARLLKALEDRGRGFDAVVIGEPQRVFYDNQFGLVFPLFVHFKVGRWVP